MKSKSQGEEVSKEHIFYDQIDYSWGRGGNARRDERAARGNKPLRELIYACR